MTTYQRLKAENAELKRQLLIVTQKPNSAEAILIIKQWKLYADIEKAMWMGDSTTENKK
jgi:hypothetical protein